MTEILIIGIVCTAGTIIGLISKKLTDMYFQRSINAKVTHYD